MRIKLGNSLRRSGALTAAAIAMAAGVPALAHADVIATFEWVGYFSNTAQNPPTTPKGTFSVDLATFNLSGTGSTAFYTSGIAETGKITALNYTFGDGVTVGLGNLGSTSIASEVWSTSATVAPAQVSTSGDYLTAALALGGTASGGTFNLTSAAGIAGATFPTGVTAASNGITPTFPPWSATDAGYWKLDSVTPVPLPAAFPLLLGGLGLIGRTMRRRTV